MVTNQPTIDYNRKWYAMAAVGMGLFLSTIDGSIVNVALPTLERELNTEFALVQWVVLAYLLALTTLLLSIGRLADMVGKKAIYTAGFVVFTIGSVLCGLAPDIHWLIGFRVVQAVGAAMILALGLAITTESFPPQERGKALGVTGAIISVGIVVGPVLGGLLLDALSWHWIFFVNLPVGIIGTWMAIQFLPDLRPAGGQRFDYLGAATLLISLLALLLALTIGQSLGFGSGTTLALFAASAVSLAAFIAIEWRARQPMIDLRLFANSLFSVNLVTGFITFVAVAGVIILIPFYLQNVLGYNQKQVGFLLAVVPVGLGLSAPVAGALSDRLGTRPITVAGLLVLFIGYYALSTLDEDTSVAGYLLRFMPVGLGMGIFQSPNNSAIMGAAPPQRLGVVSGVLAITRTLGQTVGTAILAAVWAIRVSYHAGEALPGGVTEAPAAAQVAGLQDTLLVVAIMVGLALLLSAWGLLQERRQVANRLPKETAGVAEEVCSS
ncbi:MAG: MFS transporter [Chloroflexi bacterium]|nr:MFS transporter [Chloroflexota bacterium]MCI0577365.1 MFS transporter [Chloroflexota bacterium]MCI0647052.1 MFS transporter [Chloroflexota bacterium]MCI0731539.1 MFS transporter [Chloroflexota bacterium]